MIIAPNLAEMEWLQHGFGQRASSYPSSITTLKQVHSCLVVEASAEGGDRIGEGDALVTDRGGMLVGIRTADCVPVLLADRRTMATAAIHAGWRGTAGSIVTETVKKMSAQFGTRAEDVAAAIGPSIGGCCYEVGSEVARQFGTWVPTLKQAEGPVKLDLRAINELQLRQAGVEDVWISGDCTFCSSEYYSFRREREEAGRMVSFIGRRPG
jgi:YfiH family protein